MIDIIRITAVSMISLILIIVVKQYKPEFSLVVLVGSLILLSIYILIGLLGIMDDIKLIFEQASVESDVFKVLFKTLGICYLVQFSADICRDYGQTSLAGKIEFSGKVAVLIITLPIIKSLLQIATELIG